jgi:hypothetical protein
VSGRWWVVAAVLVVALAAGYGWGSLTSSSTSSLPHNAGLCGGPIPDYLAVQRVGGLYTSKGVIEPADLPEHVALTDSPRILSLRNAICAAPAPNLTGSVVHCPEAYPLVYDMTFASGAGTSLLAVAEFSPTGCAGLSGLGLTPRFPNMKFQEALLAAMGLPPASFNPGSPFLAM